MTWDLFKHLNPKQLASLFKMNKGKHREAKSEGAKLNVKKENAAARRRAKNKVAEKSRAEEPGRMTRRDLIARGSAWLAGGAGIAAGHAGRMTADLNARFWPRGFSDSTWRLIKNMGGVMYQAFPQHQQVLWLGAFVNRAGNTVAYVDRRAQIVLVPSGRSAYDGRFIGIGQATGR